MEYIIGGIIILAVIILLIFRNKKKKLTIIQKKEIIKFFNKIKKNSSNKEKIIDFDKLYHKILLDLGYSGSFGNILKKEPKEILNLNKVWELHKIRNKLVHDFSEYSEKDLNNKSSDFQKEIYKILENI